MNEDIGSTVAGLMNEDIGSRVVVLMNEDICSPVADLNLRKRQTHKNITPHIPDLV
jgi:hypothetical protein